MRSVRSLILAVIAALGTGCKSPTGPGNVPAGTWTLTLTSLQSAGAITCPATVIVTVVVTQTGKHGFTGTYTGTAESCTGGAGTVAIVNASGTTLGQGVVRQGTISFNLDTQAAPSGGGFTGAWTVTDSSATGTVNFDTGNASLVVNGNWTLVKV